MRRCVSARSRMHKPEPNARLEAALRTACSFSGDIVNFFCARHACALLPARAQRRVANGSAATSPVLLSGMCIRGLTRRPGGERALYFLFAENPVQTAGRDLR